MTGEQIRAILLQVVSEYAKKGLGHFQQGPILEESARRMGVNRGTDSEQALLTYWGDLFRQGHLDWGYDIANPGPPFCHLSTRGRETLKNISRDPANPTGYLAHVASVAKLNPIARSYIEEALTTYNANCFKATAVMAGAASESIVIELRDAIAARLGFHGRAVPVALTDWRVKRVLDAIDVELSRHSRAMSPELRTSFEAYWPAFVQQIRAVRNDAGHPSNIDPVTPETVHGSLLIFPELARLATHLIAWVGTSMP